MKYFLYFGYNTVNIKCKHLVDNPFLSSHQMHKYAKSIRMVKEIPCKSLP